jgi:mediator of RNA polymerase II transcription subunit 18
MYELLLYGQVPAVRHEQVLKILAGVAAMQPRRGLERHIVYRPTREPEEPGAHLSRRGGTQTVVTKQVKQTAAKDLYHCQLVQKLSDADFGRQDGSGQPAAKALSAAVEPGGEPKWSLEFKDLADTGDRGVSVRASSSTDLLSGDPHAWIIAAGPHQ